MVAMDFLLAIVNQSSRDQNKKQSEYEKDHNRGKNVLTRDKSHAGKDHRNNDAKHYYIHCLPPINVALKRLDVWDSSKSFDASFESNV